MKREIRGGSALLTAYIQDKSEAIHASEARPAVLIFPGGGYEFVSDPEGEPVALAYAAKGFQTFVLKYSVKDKGVFPAPQREAFEAIAVIRRNAAEFMVDPDKIAVVGFSAGGHLAASTASFGTTPKLMTRRAPKSADRMRSFSSIPALRRENLPIPVSATCTEKDWKISKSSVSKNMSASRLRPPSFVIRPRIPAFLQSIPSYLRRPLQEQAFPMN